MPQGFSFETQRAMKKHVHPQGPREMVVQLNHSRERRVATQIGLIESMLVV